MTRQGRRTDPCLSYSGTERARLVPFLSILCNNIQIYGSATETAPPTYIVRTLVERGMIAYDTRADRWAACVREGRNLRTGFPRWVRLRGDEGQLSAPIDVSDPQGPVHVYYANAFANPVAGEVRARVDMLDFVNMAILQNINAIKQATLISYNDPSIKDQVERAQREREAGASTVTLYGGAMGNGVEIQNFASGATSNIPDLMQVWAATMEELDGIVGRASLGEKQERRITEEVTVIENAASSSIDVIIDTVNKFADWYGDDVHAVRGSALRATEQEEVPEESPAEEEEQQDADDGNK